MHMYRRLYETLLNLLNMYNFIKVFQILEQHIVSVDHPAVTYGLQGVIRVTHWRY